MKYAVIICRTLMGLAFIVFGANALHPFMPMPPLVEGSPIAQWMGLMGSGWGAFIGFFQLLGGLLVISGRLAPLGLVILSPILANIFAFHIFLEGGQNLVPGIVFMALELFLVYAYRSYFLPFFSPNAKPN